MARATAEAPILKPRVRPRTTPEARWDDLLTGQGRAAKKRSKLIANRSRNWLIAATTLACAKVKANQSLSDLEQHLVKSLRTKEVGERLIAAMAHVHTATPAAQKRLMFPDHFAELKTTDSITFADLAEHAPGLVRQTLQGPHVRVLDVDAIHAGRVRLREQMTLQPASLDRYGSSILRAVITEPPTDGTVVTRAAVANRYTIKASSFRCLEESSEWSASDEVYWLFGSVAKGFQMTNGTKTYNGVDAGEALNLENDEGCFWGMDCQPHTFPDGDIGAVATLIEHDEGDQSDVLDGWTIAFTSAAGVLTAAGVTAWVAAVVAAVGAIGAFFIELLADDHIADASWSFNRASINEVLDKHGGSYDVTQIFSDGDARYKLRIRVSRLV